MIRGQLLLQLLQVILTTSRMALLNVPVMEHIRWTVVLTVLPAMLPAINHQGEYLYGYSRPKGLINCVEKRTAAAVLLCAVIADYHHGKEK